MRLEYLTTRGRRLSFRINHSLCLSRIWGSIIRPKTKVLRVLQESLLQMWRSLRIWVKLSCKPTRTSRTKRRCMIKVSCRLASHSSLLDREITYFKVWSIVHQLQYQQAKWTLKCRNSKSRSVRICYKKKWTTYSSKLRYSWRRKRQRRKKY